MHRFAKTSSPSKALDSDVASSSLRPNPSPDHIRAIDRVWLGTFDTVGFPSSRDHGPRAKRTNDSSLRQLREDTIFGYRLEIAKGSFSLSSLGLQAKICRVRYSFLCGAELFAFAQ